jgi:hypothetical protein
VESSESEVCQLVNRCVVEWSSSPHKARGINVESSPRAAASHTVVLEVA